MLFIIFSLLTGAGLEARKDLGTFESGGLKGQVQVVFQDTGVIWGFDFLPDDRIILTFRDGRLLIFQSETGKVSVVTGLPTVFNSGQGGLLDVLVDPKFAENRWVFWTFSEAREGGSTTSLARARLVDDSLQDINILLRAKPTMSTNRHYGSRIVMSSSRELFMTVGDRGHRYEAQNLDSHLGKVLRLTEEGNPYPNNPIAEREDAKSEIWTLGHRNAQGLTFHPETQELWLQEHGPRGGDEINLVLAGRNYGWPLVTKGYEYHGPSIGKQSLVGKEDPVHNWTPSIAPSGLTFYFGSEFNHWQGSLFSGALAGQHLNRLTLTGDGEVSEERLLQPLRKRIRNVKEGPEGALYLSTDDGYLLRLVRKNK